MLFLECENQRYEDCNDNNNNNNCDICDCDLNNNNHSRKRLREKDFDENENEEQDKEIEEEKEELKEEEIIMLNVLEGLNLNENKNDNDMDSKQKQSLSKQFQEVIDKLLDLEKRYEKSKLNQHQIKLLKEANQRNLGMLQLYSSSCEEIGGSPRFQTTVAIYKKLIVELTDANSQMNKLQQELESEPTITLDEYLLEKGKLQREQELLSILENKAEWKKEIKEIKIKNKKLKLKKCE